MISRNKAYRALLFCPVSSFEMGLRSGRRLNRLASDPGLSATPPEHHWTSPKGSGMA